MIRYLLDADTALYAIRRNACVVERIAGVGAGALCLSALVHSQLLQGVQGQPNPIAEQRLIDALVSFVTVEPYDVAASETYGRIVLTLGYHRRHAFDRMIAAHAISLGATLVTNNVRDFIDIPGLPVTNWAAE